ncbi:MAG: hypothetical protein Q8R76_11480 [Candidatus Omnitrophota bacterium]|nr:hypothetical protein [Candidatus Omnitrophota bacterium]
MRTHTLALLIILFAAAAQPAMAADSSWELVKREGAVSLYSRPDPDTKFNAYKGAALFEAPIETVYAAFLGPEIAQQWMFQLETIQALPAPSDVERYYMQWDLPWPIPDGDVVADMSRDFDEANRTWILWFLKQDIEFKGGSGSKRLDGFKCVWRLSAMGNNQTLVEFGLTIVPGGSFPHWAVNYWNRIFTINNVQELLNFLSEEKAVTQTPQ